MLYIWNEYNVANQLYINKNGQHSLSEKCKSKPLWGTISLQSEWLWSQSLQAINAEEGVGKGNPLTLLVGMQTSTATMENSVEIP